MDIKEFGLSILNKIEECPDLSNMNKTLLTYSFNPSFKDEGSIWLTCALALKAAAQGNFGVGAVITDKVGNIILYGHNQVFYSSFRSDLHAEMVVINQFESMPVAMPWKNYILYTSLEPCPMCLGRILGSRISIIRYAASDWEGGMVSRIDYLPKDWRELCNDKSFSKANCSPELAQIAYDILFASKVAIRSRYKEPIMGSESD